MSQFTTVVVFDAPQRGHFVKVTYDFDPAGLSEEELIEKVLCLSPGAFVIGLPDGDLYDAGPQTKRGLANPAGLPGLIDYFDRCESRHGQPIRSGR